MTVDRKYALMKVTAGDYLLPSNDGRILWRLHTYQDGRINGLDSGPWSADYWAVWKWTGTGTWAGELDEQEIDQVADSIAVGDWDRWEWCAGSLPTRKDAIEEAMRLGTAG